MIVVSRWALPSWAEGTVGTSVKRSFGFVCQQPGLVHRQCISVWRYGLSTWMIQSYSPGCANAHRRRTYASLNTPEYTSQTTCRSVQPFLHSSRHRVDPYTLQWAAASPTPQNCPLAWESRPHLIQWFLGAPAGVHNPNGISVGSAVFAALTIIVTDRQAD